MEVIGSDEANQFLPPTQIPANAGTAICTRSAVNHFSVSLQNSYKVSGNLPLLLQATFT